MSPRGGPGLLVVLVLVGTLPALPALGWIDRSDRTGTPGVHADAGADRLARPAMDGLFHRILPLPVPAPIPPAPDALVRVPAAASGALRSLAPRSPPGG